MIPARWRVLAVYTALQALMQFEWLRFAPITSEAAAHLHVSLAAIGNLSLIFPLLFLPLALPAGAWLDRVSVRTSLRVSASGMAFAAVLRIAGPGYAWIMAGQLVFAVLQSLMLAQVSRLVTAWFDDEEQLLATSLPSMAIFVGIGLAFTLVPTIGYGSMWLDVVILVALAIATWALVPADRRRPEPATARPRAWSKQFMTIVRAPAVAPLLVYFFLANGYFNVISTWLQPLLGRHGMDPTQVGLVMVGMLAGGVATMSQADRVARWLSLRQLMMIAAAGALLATGVFFTCSSLALLITAAVILGVTLLTPLPVLIDAIANAAGSARAGTSIALFWLVGNAGAVCLLAAFDPIVNSGSWLVGAIVLTVIPLLQGGVALATRATLASPG